MAERLESVKAAIIGSFGAIFTFIIVSQTNLLISVKLPAFDLNQIAVFNSLFDFHWWLGASIASFSGLLFGITYRYIIRDDNNFQLKTGGVMAFGIVRWLVQVEMILKVPISIDDFFSLALLLFVLLVESIFLFGLSALLVDKAIQLGWLQAFKSLVD
jgi:hypothetical protein